ncbi:MAG: peptidyl-prolyl cis-trans isomerase, partial [bacterium]
VSVGNMEVAKSIAADKNFQDVTGKFSSDTYRQTLQQAGMTVKEYETGTRFDLARSVLQAAVVGGIVVPATLTDTLATYAGEQRSFTLLPLTEATLPTPLPTPTEADLKAWYDAHLDAFTRPEAKRITYAALQPADLAASMPVDETAVQELYDSRKSEYVVPEKRLVERLVYPSDAEAASAKARLDAGASFESLVKDRGLELTDIDMGDVTRSQLGAAGDAVFALTSPDVVGPLPSDLGPALYRMNAILPAQDTTLAQVHDELAKEAQTAAAVKEIADKSTAIDDALAGGATLEDLVKTEGMVLHTTDYVSGAVDNDPIAADRAFAKAADAVKSGDYPEAVTLADGGIMALRLDSTVPPTPVPFDKAHDRVAAALHADALSKALTAQATAAEAAIKAGATLESEGTVIPVAATTRDATPDGTTPDVMKAAFAMTAGEVKLVDLPDFTGLIRLDSITPVDLTTPEAKAAADKLAAQARQSVAQDVYALYTAAMTAQGKLTIDQSVMNSVLTQMH